MYEEFTKKEIIELKLKYATGEDTIKKLKDELDNIKGEVKMIRYFDDAEEKVTLRINVNKIGETCTIEQLNKQFDCKLREVDRKEYNKLNKEYVK